MTSPLSFHEEYERIAALHDLPTYLDHTFLLQTFLPSLVGSILYVWGVYVALIMMGRYLFPQASQLEVNIVAHRLTHFWGNVSIAILGLYFYNALPSDASVEEKVSGFKEIHPILSLQAAKQLWAILLGLLVTATKKERAVYYLHHVAVGMVSMYLACFTMGLRYYVTLMFGVTEVSGVFLAGVELMRDFPEHGSKRFPQLYKGLGTCFAACFLYVRCYLLLPQAWEFLRFGLFILLSAPQSYNRFIVAGAWIVWIGGCFLVSLQAYWGVLVVRKFVREVLLPLLRGSPGRKTNTE
jgi:hypothetical protein